MLNSIVSIIQQPVRMSLTATLVEKPQIPKTVTYMTINADLGRCFTPMISGVSVNQTSVPDEIWGRAMGLYGTRYSAATADGATSMG